MEVGIHNITVHKGATYHPTLTWKDGGGTAINLTNYKARMQIRSTVDADTAIVDLTTENGGITLGGSAGTIAILISATATAAITEKSGFYDLELESVDGIVTRLLEGTVEFSPNVTR